MKPDLEDILKAQEARTNLELEAGTRLFLSLEGLDQKLASVYYGGEEGSHLIIQTPLLTEAVKRLKTGARITVHYMTKGTIRAFQSTVLDSVLKPFPLTFLEYPSLVARKDLRQNPRANCCLPATIALREEGYEGLMVNLSLGGCRFILSHDQEPRPPRLQADQELMISFSLREEEGHIQAKAQVCNIKKLEHLQILGLRFTFLDRQDLLTVHGYVKMVLDHCLPEVLEA